MPQSKSRAEDSKRHAANCVRLAQQNAAETDRAHWHDMAQFWLSRAEDAEADANSEPASIVVEKQAL